MKIYFRDNMFYGKKDVHDICKDFDGIADSDFMPFINDKHYVPKPAIITEGLLNLNIKDFKYHRVMKYIEISELPNFFAGGYDFEKHSSVCFGQYTCDANVGKYEFIEGAGIYAVILSDECDEEIISKAVSRSHNLDNACVIERAEIDQINECVGNKSSTAFWMLLGAIDTSHYSQQQLSSFLEGSFYQVGHKKDQPGILILPGACFKEKSEWLDEKTVLLELFL